MTFRGTEVPTTWASIIGVMIAGTIGFIGLWIQMNSKHDDNLTRIVHLEDTQAEVLAWKAEAARASVTQTEQLAKLTEGVAQLESQLNNSREERLSATATFNKRMDDLLAAVEEVQRQVSAIEGKLGDSTPDRPRH